MPKCAKCGVKTKGTGIHCRSCAQKISWQDPKTRRNRVEGMQNYFANNLDTRFKNFSEERNRNLSTALKGRKLSAEHRESISRSKKKYYASNPHPMQGRTHSQEARKKIGKASRVRQAGKVLNENRRSYLGEDNPFHGKYHTEQTKQVLKQKLQAKWSDPAWRQKVLAAQAVGRNEKPNKAEQQLQRILVALSLGYQYYGDGQSGMIAGKWPDFYNGNGKVIEMFGNYWHGPERQRHSREEEERQRIEHFAKYDISCLVVWEDELINRECLEVKILVWHEEIEDLRNA